MRQGPISVWVGEGVVLRWLRGMISHAVEWWKDEGDIARV